MTVLLECLILLESNNLFIQLMASLLRDFRGAPPPLFQMWGCFKTPSPLLPPMLTDTIYYKTTA